jgi:hypothetical protein
MAKETGDKFVYVTGPYEGINDIIRQRNKEQLNLVCRRIFVANHIPICPILFFGEYHKDPRLFSNSGWWVLKVFEPMMRLCSSFCIITSRMDLSNERLQMEQELWSKIGNGHFIPEEKILQHLLGEDADV